MGCWMTKRTVGPSKDSDALLSCSFWGPGLAWNPGILGEALRAPGERERLFMVGVQIHIILRLKNRIIFIHYEFAWILTKQMCI